MLMENISTSGAVIAASFAEIWNQLILLLPSLLGAVLVIVVGIIVSRILGRLVAKLVSKLYVDSAMEATGANKLLDKIGFHLKVSQAIGLLITWFLYAVVLVGAADILGLSQISEFLQSVVLYIPNVIIAVVILLVGTIISNFIHTLVRETSLAAELEAADILANVARIAILVFSAMAALIQLRVATSLIEILFTGLVFMFALAGGIAFGLGGKDKAKEILDRLERK